METRNSAQNSPRWCVINNDERFWGHQSSQANRRSRLANESGETAG